MSIVAPNGTVRFLSGVPIDEDYQNSLDFLSKELQTAYFLGLTPIHTLSNATRVRDGVIKVDVNCDTIMSCNYIMFQNLDFWNKWFYAFITNIEYVNNSCCNVYYVIDDIQTWMFDVTLEECFVEREHTTTDGLFEHLVDEGISVSEYVYNQTGDTLREFNSYDALLITSVIRDETTGTLGEAFIGAFAGNLNGCGVYLYNSVRDIDGNWLTIDPSKNYDNPSTSEYQAMNQLERLNAVIRMLTSANQKDSIVGLIFIPHALVNGSDTSKPQTHESLEYNNYAIGNTLNGYPVKNNKMYNAPYCCIEIGITDGQKIHLNPEYLKKGQNSLQCIINLSASSSFTVVPETYCGESPCYSKGLSYSNFGQCAMSIDGYKAWVASGGAVEQKMELIKAGYGLATGTVGALANSSKDVIGSTMKIANAVGDANLKIFDTLYKMDLAKRLPNDVIGNSSTQELISTGQLGYYAYKKCVNSDVAESIDNYFTMFGYKVNKVKTPSRRNRPHYTYVKTKGCKVVGGAPADAINRIQTIYDNGIRFWVNASEVGQYTTIDNSPV